MLPSRVMPDDPSETSTQYRGPQPQEPSCRNIYRVGVSSRPQTRNGSSVSKNSWSFEWILGWQTNHQRTCSWTDEIYCRSSKARLWSITAGWSQSRKYNVPSKWGKESGSVEADFHRDSTLRTFSVCIRHHWNSSNITAKPSTICLLERARLYILTWWVSILRFLPLQKEYSKKQRVNGGKSRC